VSDRLIKLLASFFYIGHSKYAPGTLASAVAVLIYIIVKPAFLLYCITLLVVTALGFMISEAAEKAYQQKDPSCVVIDEVAGMLLACVFLPLKPWVLLWAFLAFRFFDITKIYPIKQLENLKGGIGIMMDDLMAGIYTIFVIQLAILFKLIV